MADDKHYVGGDYYRIDDITGFKIRASRSRKQWDNAITAGHSYSSRQPQDFVRGIADDETVEDARPRQTDQFILLGSYVTEFAAAWQKFIVVASSAGMQPGDVLQIMLDTGENFRTYLIAVSGNTLRLRDVLPATVGGPLGDPIENSVLDLGPSNPPLRVFILNSPTNGILNQNLLG